MLALLLGLARLGQTYKRTYILSLMNLYKNLYFVSWLLEGLTSLPHPDWRGKVRVKMTEKPEWGSGPFGAPWLVHGKVQ